MLNSLWQIILAVITYFSVKKVGGDEQVIKQQQEVIKDVLKHKKDMASYDNDPTVRTRVRSKYTTSK
jgi:hypothetical protein